MTYHLRPVQAFAARYSTALWPMKLFHKQSSSPTNISYWHYSNEHGIFSSNSIKSTITVRSLARHLHARIQVRWSITFRCSNLKDSLILIGPDFYGEYTNEISILWTFTGIINRSFEQHILHSFVECMAPTWQSPSAPTRKHKKKPGKDIWETKFGYDSCVERPAHSPDFNLFEFFLWDYLKEQLYKTPPRTLQNLQHAITYAYTSVLPDMQRNL